VSTHKILCAVSLGSFLVLGAGLIIGAEVRAGGLDDVDLPVQAVVDQTTLDDAQAFDGAYVFDGGQKQQEGVLQAIETAVAALNPLVRNLGRTRLQESNTIPKHLAIETDGEAVSILFDGNGHSAKLDGTPRKAESSHGDKIKVSHRMRGPKLTEFIDGVGGDRHNEFKLSADGSRLTVKVKISSSQLPVPVEYDLSYKRK
jgi:hypothetical protein